VANAAVGYDKVDVAACAARGVVCTNTPGVLTDATADISFALILASTRRLGEAERMIRAGGTWSWSMFFMLGSGLQGKTLGIVGLGQIGTATARRARAFGMTIAYTARRQADAALEAELGATRLDLDELLATADVVSIHCPLTDATRHLIGRSLRNLVGWSTIAIGTSRKSFLGRLTGRGEEERLAATGVDLVALRVEQQPARLELRLDDVAREEAGAVRAAVAPVLERL